MERRLNKKIQTYLQNFKTELVENIQNIQNIDNKDDLISFVYNYNKLELVKDDLIKRKRIKNTVPVFERCCAKRANNEQCTRRKKEGNQYCGTHSKGTPHGVITDNIQADTTVKKELSVVEIQGIVHYIDNDKHVYNTADVLSNKQDPRVIAHYEKNDEQYTVTGYT
jgi:hypothetical protein